MDGYIKPMILSNDLAPETLDAMFSVILDDINTQEVFEVWWGRTEGQGTRYARLSRWFSLMAAADDHTYTLRWYQESVSDSSAMTPLDDLAAKSAGALVTEQSTDTPDWTESDRMLWYVRANAESLADGTMDVLAVEGVDDNFDVTGELAPVYVFSVAPWVYEYEDESYEYRSWRLKRAEGYYPYAGDVGLDGEKRAMTWMPAFAGALDSSGALTSGAGRAIYNFRSAEEGLAAARKRTNRDGGHSEGLWNDCDTIRLLHAWQLRHFNLENSGILEGCTSYDVDHTVAAAESGVRRVLVTQAHGADYLVGSAVTVTTATSRANASTGVALLKRIVSKETVEVGGTTYTALNLDVSETITTTTAMHVFSMPWNTGSTETLPGHKDGSLYSLTDGKTPARIAGVEVLVGAYTVGIEPLYSVTRSGSYDTYKIYECRDCENIPSGTISSIPSVYRDTGISKGGIVSGWQYPRSFIRTLLGVLFPDVVSGGSTTTRYKSGFYGTDSAGVRCPWRFGSLANAGSAGLACEAGYSSPAHRSWNGAPWLAGAGKKRGEWTA